MLRRVKADWQVMLAAVAVACAAEWPTWTATSSTVRFHGGTLLCSSVARAAVEGQGKRVVLAALVSPDRQLEIDLAHGVSRISTSRLHTEKRSIQHLVAAGDRDLATPEGLAVLWPSLAPDEGQSTQGQ